MRSLFVCLLLGVLAWLAGGADPSAEPLVYLGMMMALPALAVRLAPGYGRLAHVGPLAVGLLLGWTGLASGAGLAAIQPYVDLAAVWVGLHLGGSLPLSLLRDRRTLSAVTVAAACPIILCFAVVALLLPVSTESAIVLALLSPVSAPLFVHLSQPQRKQAAWLSVTMTCLGLLIWLVAVRPSGLLPRPGPDAAVGLLIWAVGVEVFHRGNLAVRTAPGHHLLQGAAALVLSIASARWGLPPLFVGLGTGLVLSARSPRSPRWLDVSGPVATMAIPLVLAAFVAGLSGSAGSAQMSGCWPVLIVYAAALAAGKLGGVYLASRLAPLPARDWLQTLPQGLPAALLVVTSLPAHAVPAGAGAGTLAVGLLGFAGVGVSLLVWPLEVLTSRWRRRPH